MKSVGYILIAAFIVFSPVEGARRSKSKAPVKISFNWWPRQTFQEKQNNITLTARALSEDETRSLFLDEGKYLVNMTWYGIKNPIIPVCISIKNEGTFPITLSEKCINLGTTWYGSKRAPVKLANILDTLNNHWNWSSSVIVRSTYIDSWTGASLATATATSYEANSDPLMYSSFFKLNDLTLPDLYNADMSLLYGDRNAGVSVAIPQGQSRDIIMFAWGKEINPNFSISLAKNTFHIDLHTAPVSLETK